MLLSLLLAVSIQGAVPDMLVGVFSGASQNSAWCTGGSDPVDTGFMGDASAKTGRQVWEEELHRFAPGVTVDAGSRVKAGVGFVGHWWTAAEGLTADGVAVREDLLRRMRDAPAAAGFVCHVLASAGYNEASPERFRTELAGYAQALNSAVEAEFGVGKRTFRFWWLAPGNRWGQPEDGQDVAAARRRVPLALAGIHPFFRVAPATMAYVIGDWNASGDGIHYPRASNQRAGRQLACSMLLDWGVHPGGATREPTIDSVTRDPADPQALRVRVLTNGGNLVAHPAACRVATVDGQGLGTGKEGVLLASEWTCEVDNATASEGHSTVRLRWTKALPPGELTFSHTWGTWHVVTPGRPGYQGPLAVWHEAVGGGAGMTQDFADLTTSPRPVILALGTAQLVPVAAERLPSPPIDAHRLPSSSSIRSNPSLPIEVPPHRRYGVWNSGRIGGGGYLQHASFSKADPDRIFLATDVGGCYRTDDGGRTWRMLHGALPSGEGSTQVRGILAHPTRRDTFLIAAGSRWDAPLGVFRSDDAGATFTLTLPARFEGNDGTRGEGFVLAADPSQPERVYAAPIGLGPHRSDDFGRTWQSLGLTGVYARDLVVDRANPDRLWVNAANRGDQTWDAPEGKRPFQHGLFVTADGGTTWERLPGDELPIEMVQDPVDASLLHASFRKTPQLRRSRDGGRTWLPYDNPDFFPKPGNAREDGTYAALATGPDYVLAAGHGGHFYRLPAAGGTWAKLPRPTVHEEGWYAALTAPIEPHFGSALGFTAVSPHDPARWLFTDWYACYLSPDAGATWNLAIDGIEMTVLHCLAQDPASPSRVHAGMADIGYFRSDDGGATFPLWGRHGGIGNNVKHLAVCASRSTRLYAVGPITWQWVANQTFRSDDAGTTWTRPAQRGLPNLADNGGARCNTITVRPDRPDDVFLVVSGPVKPGEGGVYRSVNAGDDWEWCGAGLPEEPLFRKDIWVSGPELAVSADGSMVAMSNDRGRGFAYHPAASRWTELALPHAGNCVTADPLASGRYYAALKEAGLFRSDDGGRTWRNVFGGFAAFVTVDAARKDRLAVSTGESNWVSSDAGATWARVGEGLPYRHFRNVLSFAGERLVCGTGGSGIFWTELAHIADVPVAKSSGQTFTVRSGPLAGGAEAGGSVPTPSPSLVANGDMAAGGATPADWSLSGGANAQRTLARDAAVFASAPAALRLDVRGTAAVAQQRLAGQPAGKTLDASCRVRLEGTLKPVQFVFQCFDGNWRQVAWKIVGMADGKGEWVAVRGRVEIPSNAANVLVGLLVDGQGSAWWDDVSVAEVGAPPAALPAQPLAQVLPPDDPRIHYGGRWDRRDPAGPRAAWPGSAVTVRFRGTRLNAVVHEPNANRYEVFVDGARTATLAPAKGTNLLRVADGLADGEHTVRLVKRTESFFGVVQVRGWQLDAGADLLDSPRPVRALEFVGDSITCGYGNEAPDQTHKFNAETENAAAAYGFLAAQALGADYTAVAWSGKRLWPGNSILDLYGRILPQDESSAWDFAAARQPDAVLVNLGTNDFAGGNPEEEGWIGAYVAFVKRLRAQYPSARIYCVVGPMMSDAWSASKTALTTIRGYLRRVVAESGDDNIAFIEFPMQDGKLGFGADWHPSRKTHQRMAEQLASTLRTDLGW